MNEQMIEAQDVIDAPLPVVNPANGTPMPKPKLPLDGSAKAQPRVVFVQTDEQFPDVKSEDKPTLH